MKKRVLLSLAVGVCLAMGLTGCGSDVDGSVSGDTPSGEVDISSNLKSFDSKSKEETTKTTEKSSDGEDKTEYNMQAGVMSSGAGSGQLSYGSDVITLPTELSGVLSWGLVDMETQKELDTSVKVNAHDSKTVELTDNQTKFTVIITNQSDGVTTLDKCNITDISITRLTGEDGNYIEAAVVLPGGVTMNMGRDAIINVLGEGTTNDGDLLEYDTDKYLTQFVFQDDINQIVSCDISVK